MRTNMKRILSALLAGGMILSLVGCGNDEPPTYSAIEEPVISAAASGNNSDSDVFGTSDKPAAAELNDKEKINIFQSLIN